MKCPLCHKGYAQVVIMAAADKVVRTRQCLTCGYRFNTVETWQRDEGFNSSRQKQAQEVLDELGTEEAEPRK